MCLNFDVQKLRMAEKSSLASKMLLKNHIIHANSHNKIVEESLMWKKYEKMKGENSSDSETGYRSRRKRLSQSSRPKDCTTGHGRGSKNISEVNKPSFYWTQQLQKAEAAMEDRWDHSGYKELHPEEFQSGSETEISQSDKSLKRKRKHKLKKKKHKVKRDSDNYNESEQECNRKKFKKCKYSTKLVDTHEKQKQSHPDKSKKTIPDQWDHSGYRDMHPDEFQSRSDKERSRERKKHKHKKRKHKLEKMDDSYYSEEECDKKKFKRKSRTKSHEKKAKKHKRSDSRKFSDSSD
jgi:hypothetical protein